MARGISLANKSLLLFSFAVLILLTAALSVPWVRTPMIVREGQFETARQLADAWMADRIQLGSLALDERGPRYINEIFADPDEAPVLRMNLFTVDEIDRDDDRDPFLGLAFERFQDDRDLADYTATTRIGGQVVYRYARPIRESQWRAIQDHSVVDFTAGALDPAIADPLRAILIIDRRSERAEAQLLLNRMWILAAGLLAGMLAVLVFWFILTKLILSPVRRLRRTADRVEAGDLTIRASIRTGDEFEHLSDAFNAMLERVEQSQAQLRSMNESLDLKLSELAEANIGLYESNRLKSEFLANVSHELRTPLNSIIGFAEVLEGLAHADGQADPKRLRYLQNILNSGRSLLEMINELLQMAKIEAGRIEVGVESTSISDLVEGLVGIMGPQAKSKSITIETHVAANLPVVETDPGKLQQILYNFLSNAVKFTPAGGTVAITAERVIRQSNEAGVRISVSDNGPGIPYDMQDAIFEKFRQIDAVHTREHAGTGLGLAICRELAEMLGASVSLSSEPGRGATFYVDLPLAYQPERPQSLMA